MSNLSRLSVDELLGSLHLFIIIIYFIIWHLLGSIIDLCSVSCHFASLDSSPFQRSYTPEVMRECLNRMAQYNVIPGHHLELFRNMCEQAEKMYKSKQCDEIELEDAPEEFKGELSRSDWTLSGAMRSNE